MTQTTQALKSSAIQSTNYAHRQHVGLARRRLAAASATLGHKTPDAAAIRTATGQAASGARALKRAAEALSNPRTLEG